MRYLILRDDDTSAVTPVECLDTLYRPFLERQLPIVLAVIPDVNLEATLSDGTPEHFLPFSAHSRSGSLPIGEHSELTAYLKRNKGYQIAQHGCHHDHHEFLINDKKEIIRRLTWGKEKFLEAGLGSPTTFVAPQDKLSAEAIKETAKRYKVISTGWFERSRLPATWWPHYFLSKWQGKNHWKWKNCLLLSRPASCLTRLYRPEHVLPQIWRSISEHKLTVINTHWWEFFPDGKPDQSFIKALHRLAEEISQQQNIQLITFDQLLDGTLPLKEINEIW